MTVHASAWAWNQQGLDPAEKLLLLALAESSSEDAYPRDIEGAAILAGIESSEAHHLAQQLREKGLVDKLLRTAEY